MHSILRRLALGLTAAILPGISSLPPALAQTGTYTARGQEPGWSLTIDDRTIAFARMAGDRFEAPKPARHQTPQGDRYDVTFDGRPVQILIEQQICRDIMSGMPHPDRVTISGLNCILTGCGGAPRALLGTDEWSITEIGSSPVLGGTAPTIAFFDDNVVAGNGSCNRFRGGFKLTGEGLRIEQLATTMMACPDPVMQQEHALVRQLEATHSFDIRADGALILKDTKGGALVAVRKPK